MSAIAAIFALDGRPISRAAIISMTDRLEYRGRDDGGEWTRGSVALGHRMFWTTPESLGEQLPIATAEESIVMTSDARIDNRAELIAMLGIIGASGQISDSRIILAAYQKWGEHCPEKLLGDFAFAIWDERRESLFCARDHMGVKPLYYYSSRRLFACASEIKALLGLPEVPARLNEARVADYLLPMLEDKESTFYEGILRLPPAHCMTITRDSMHLREYWHLDPSRQITLGSDDEYAEAFREIFSDAVRCRLRSAFPIGSALSGGLDSSSVTCMARTLLAESGGGDLHTFSARFPDVEQCDEGAYIESVVRGGGIRAHQIRADRLHPLGEVERALRHQDEPLYGPNMFIHCGIYRAAQEAGVRVLLEGIDGDTTVSHGITYLNELTRAGRWIRFAGEINGLARELKIPPRVILWRRGIKPAIPQFFRRGWRSLQSNDAPWSATGIVDPDFARRTRLSERAESLFADRSTPARTAREYHWRGLTSGVIPLALEEPDRTAAEFGIEPRYPFFDRRLVEFCLALPGDQKINRGWTRVVMRRAMAGILPEEVRWRKGKGDLSPNFSRNLLAFDRSYLDDLLVRNANQLRGYIDLEALQKNYQRSVAGSSAHDAVTIWRAATLALWLRRFNQADHRNGPHIDSLQGSSY